MIFLLISIVVPIALWALLPWTMHKVTTRRFERNGLLLTACVCFFISWYLPSPSIHGMDTQFTTHVVGGGIFSGLLWLYGKKQLHWNTSWLLELITIFSLVSSLGVLNELFELVTVELHLTQLSGRDTWWDLLANTFGALFVWLLHRLSVSLREKKNPSA